MKATSGFQHFQSSGVGKGDAMLIARNALLSFSLKISIIKRSSAKVERQLSSPGLVVIHVQDFDQDKRS